MTVLVEYVRAGRTYAATPEEFLDELSYRSYVSQRRQSPQEWRAIFGDRVARFEARYQHSLGNPPVSPA
mgnify:CR=1 FL=1